MFISTTATTISRALSLASAISIVARCVNGVYVRVIIYRAFRHFLNALRALKIRRDNTLFSLLCGYSAAARARYAALQLARIWCGIIGAV